MTAVALGRQTLNSLHPRSEILNSALLKTQNLETLNPRPFGTLK